MTTLGLLLWIAAGASAPPAQPLRAGCDAQDQEIAEVTQADEVRVLSAIIGGDQACYQLVLRRGESEVTGYFLGENLPAIEKFVRQREKADVAAFEAQSRWAHRMAAQPKPVHDRASEAGLKPGVPAVFEDFSARNTTGKYVSLSGLGGRVVLVTFWSPSSPASVRQLVSLMPLYNHYKRSGLKALGISADPNASHAAQALDDITPGWPQVPDRAGLAKRYGADVAAGTTLVLDRSHHVVGVALSAADLEQKVQQLLAQP